MEDSPRPVDPSQGLQEAPVQPARPARSGQDYLLGPMVAGPVFLGFMWIGAFLDAEFGWGVFYEALHAVMFSCLLSPLALIGGVLAAFFVRGAQRPQRATVLWSVVAGAGAALLVWLIFLIIV